MRKSLPEGGTISLFGIGPSPGAPDGRLGFVVLLKMGEAITGDWRPRAVLLLEGGPKDVGQRWRAARRKDGRDGASCQGEDARLVLSVHRMPAAVLEACLEALARPHLLLPLLEVMET